MGGGSCEGTPFCLGGGKDPLTPALSPVRGRGGRGDPRRFWLLLQRICSDSFECSLTPVTLPRSKAGGIQGHRPRRSPCDSRFRGECTDGGVGAHSSSLYRFEAEVPLTPALSPLRGARGEEGRRDEGMLFPAVRSASAGNLQGNLPTASKPIVYTQKPVSSNGFSVIAVEAHPSFFPRPLQADPPIGLRVEGGGPGWGWPYA